MTQFKTARCFRKLMATRQQKVSWGKKLEQILHTTLELFLNCKLTPTEYTYDSVDFKGTVGVVENKGRPKFRNNNPRTPQDSKSFPDWYFPVCKTTDTEVPLHIFYYWEGDDTLWYLVYNKEKFLTYKKGVPPAHPTNQLHFLIPKSDFVEISQARRRALLQQAQKAEQSQVSPAQADTQGRLILV